MRKKERKKKKEKKEITHSRARNISTHGCNVISFYYKTEKKNLLHQLVHSSMHKSCSLSHHISSHHISVNKNRLETDTYPAHSALPSVSSKKSPPTTQQQRNTHQKQGYILLRALHPENRNQKAKETSGARATVRGRGCQSVPAVRACVCGARAYACVYVIGPRRVLSSPLPARVSAPIRMQ